MMSTSIKLGALPNKAMRVVTTLGLLPVVYICTCLLVANLPLQLVPYSLKNDQFTLHKSINCSGFGTQPTLGLAGPFVSARSARS